MTESEIKRIEAELAVALPTDYRRILLHFPIRYDAGKAKGPLWDNADALIDRNRKLRTARTGLDGNYRPIPDNFLFIGDDGAGWQHLLDLPSDPPLVYVMEYEDINRINAALSDDDEPQSLRDWFHAQLIELRNEGVDISAAEESSGFDWGCVFLVIGFCVVMALAITLMVAGVQSLLGH